MDWLKLTAHTIVYFVVTVAVSTVFALLFGPLSPESSNLLEQHLMLWSAGWVASFCVLFLIARSREKPGLLYLVLVVIISKCMDTLIVSFLIDEFYVPPLWFVEAPIVFSAVLLAYLLVERGGSNEISRERRP